MYIVKGAGQPHGLHLHPGVARMKDYFCMAYHLAHHLCSTATGLDTIVSSRPRELLRMWPQIQPVSPRRPVLHMKTLIALHDVIQQ